ncbi:lytic transglycosylase domain-containing protein [Kushneria indalinina]|uniref:lytic transglycosylase domain-containing protein n=1 Tax=Kushneria indalinina TaxID=184067 RepID=UPI001FE63C7C|nr:lytic transglycosylase domain-containing protein [Kushneria indalinina]
MSRRLTSYLPETPQRLALLESIQRESLRASLDLQLVLSVIDVESRFTSRAVSSAGAEGLMQVMPFWKKEIGRDSDDLFDPDTNLRYGCTILAWYLKVEKGDITRALARYNGSLGKTGYPEQVMTRWDTRWWIDS